MAASRDEISGTLILGRYRVVQPLARGGMGVVYLARTEGAAGFTRPVVVKRITADLAGDEATTQAFVREARILANLQYPGIVNVIDFDEEDGVYVMVLEYVHGYNIGQWLRYVVETRQQMPVDYAIYIVTHVLDALQYAHTFTRSDGVAMQIVHRDVSPGNILIDMQGHVKLLDFGIARASVGGEYKTQDGMFKGKLAYSAPEVYDGKSASPRSDVYSTAVVLYQLLSGENPFRGKDVAEIVRRVFTAVLPPIAALRDDVPAELDGVLQKALSRDPEDRFPSAGAFADALRAIRPRRDEDFVTELADDVWNDFNGDMAEKLGLESLQKRDAAWRTTTGDGSRGGLASTPPPGGPPVDTLVDRVGTVGAPSESPTLTETAIAGAPGAASRPRGPRASVPFLAIGSALVALGAAGFAWSISQKRGDSGSRFVVVEKEARDDSVGPAVAAPVLVPAATGSDRGASSVALPFPASPPSAAASSPGAGGDLTAKTARPTAAPDPATLSRAVQRQRGRIEACFLTHVKEVDGRPEVSVRFQVAPSGHVESAALSPAALGGTPLGVCLLGVARGTDFGAQSAPVAFTIPITARRVK
jgi:serine/threonine-protein kinase